MNNKTVIIIPARKGSKRVPGKNTKLLCGKKLIEYTIEHAINSKKADDIFISTDDDSISDIAERYNCKFLRRGEELSNDKASTGVVIDDFLERAFESNSKPDNIVLLQPTVPFRRKTLTDEAIELLETGDYDSVTTHIEVDFYHPNRLKKIEGQYLVPYKEKENESVNRDMLEKVYCRDGAVYAFRTESYIKTKSFLGDRQGYLINDIETHVNIDTYKDWYVAEALIGNM